jgi:dephospho-CoA kinase
MAAVLRVALTGGIGSGKSTVASKFQNLGVPIIDSDIISRNIVRPGNPCFNSIVQEFGKDILTSEGKLDRKKLRDIIFNDDTAKIKLEEITHPAIYQDIEARVSNVNYPYCIIVIPLLIETQATNRFDRILVVDVSDSLQIKRASNRDKTTTENIEKIMKNQVNRMQRLKYADDVIENNLTIEELNDSVLKLHNMYIMLSSNKN